MTTKQESAIAVFMQRPEVHGPPAYYSQDWEVDRPAIFGREGVISVPPDVPHPLLLGAAGLELGFAVGKMMRSARNCRA